jgi:hypothetical protein
MTDRPILFSGPMVRALLAGTKTQTRRVLTPQPPEGARYSGIHFASNDPDSHFFNSPSGPLKVRQRIAEGDRLYVRERAACGECAPGKPSHWAPSFWRREQGTPKNPNGLWYEADGLAPETPITDRGRWVQGMFMPRWASRLTLLVTDVRVQRLQEITTADALLVGVDVGLVDGKITKPDTRDSYRQLWDNLNAARGYGWETNPWVVAVSFIVQHGNIDARAA